MTAYLNPGLPQPMAAPDGLDAAYWEGLDNDRLLIQKCRSCGIWQWGPEWLCHSCNSFEMDFEEVPAQGQIFSYERVWHPVHPALQQQGAYLVVLVELPQAGNVRLVGNLMGDPQQAVTIGAVVEGVFEHHTSSESPFTLLQWRVVERAT